MKPKEVFDNIEKFRGCKTLLKEKEDDEVVKEVLCNGNLLRLTLDLKGLNGKPI